MRALLALSALLLAGCWSGALFYDSSDLHPAIAPGRYRLVDPVVPDRRPVVAVTLLADGRTQVVRPGNSDDSMIVGFSLLDGAEGTFVGWLAPEPGEPFPADDVPYFLVREERSGSYRVTLPQCDPDGLVARWADVEPRAVPNCRFSNREDLEQAMRHINGDSEAFVRLVPVI